LAYARKRVLATSAKVARRFMATFWISSASGADMVVEGRVAVVVEIPLKAEFAFGDAGQLEVFIPGYIEADGRTYASLGVETSCDTPYQKKRI
jgi:hypothetical protein